MYEDEFDYREKQREKAQLNKFKERPLMLEEGDF